MVWASHLQNMPTSSLHVGMMRQTDTAPIVPSIMAAVAMTRITLVLINRGITLVTLAVVGRDCGTGDNGDPEREGPITVLDIEGCRFIGQG